MIKLIKKAIECLKDCLHKMGDGFATPHDERAKRKDK